MIDPRYVEAHHPEATLHAWAGHEGRDMSLDMGGWTDADAEAFERAVRDELCAQDRRVGPTLDIAIHAVRRNVDGVISCCYDLGPKSWRSARPDRVDWMRAHAGPRTSPEETPPQKEPEGRTPDADRDHPE